MQKATAALNAMLLERHSRLMDIQCIGPVAGARILADRDRFASRTETAPLDASPGWPTAIIETREEFRRNDDLANTHRTWLNAA